MIKERLIDYVRDSISKNWDIEALSDYQGKSFTYRDIAERILKLHMIFGEAGIKEGDKVALLGKNSANWCSVYLATVTYGAVSVPIMPDFKPDDLTNIINHSDSLLLFADEKLWAGLKYASLPELRSVFKLETFDHIEGRDKKTKELSINLDRKFEEKYPAFSAADMKPSMSA